MTIITHKKIEGSLCRQRGAATLLVAVILLVAMTLGAFYLQRVLVAEQDVAGGYYRSVRAQMAADAGLELTVSLLQKADTKAAFLNADRSPKAGWHSLSSTALNFSSEGGAAAAGVITAAVNFEDLSPPGRAGDILRVVTRGCWREVGVSLGACNPCSSSCPTTAVASQVVAFRGALVGAPSAPLTAKGNVDFGSSSITVVNQDESTNGLTIHAGGEVTTKDDDKNLVTLPGTPPEATIAEKDSEIAATEVDDFFEKFFGKTKAEFKDGADLVVSCGGGGKCNGNHLGETVKSSKVIYVDLPPGVAFELNANTVVGSLAEPVILMVNGPIELRGNVEVYGVVYSASTLWDNTGGGTAKVIGAAVAEGDFKATGTPNPIYNGSVLEKLSSGLGAFVKVPGSWRDF